MPLLGDEADLVLWSSPDRLEPPNSEETALTPDRISDRLREPSDGFSVAEALELTGLTAAGRRGVEAEGREAVACTARLVSAAADPPAVGSGYRSLSTDLRKEYRSLNTDLREEYRSLSTDLRGGVQVTEH